MSGLRVYCSYDCGRYLVVLDADKAPAEFICPHCEQQALDDYYNAQLPTQPEPTPQETPAHER